MDGAVDRATDARLAGPPVAHRDGIAVVAFTVARNLPVDALRFLASDA